MSTFKGPFRIVFEELRIQFYIIAIITIVLTALYVCLGIINANNDETFNVGANFGPVYGFLLLYPFFFFNNSYQYTLALGGTRKQFMLAASISGILFIVCSMLIINLLLVLNGWLIEQQYSSSTIFHMGDLLPTSNPFLYYCLDLFYGVFLFGTGVFISSIWFKFGTVRTLALATVIGMVAIISITFGDLSLVWDTFLHEQLLFAFIVGAIGIIALVFAYFLMRNGPLERGGDGGFFGKKSRS
ncbi:hypothetical protein JCM19046_2672 [Bacillus sp. JCM 19046]|uniref:Membrane-anchored protein n=1 Tax=Shouchella xiaoxiensis TaxID=766895 RepID=A0ABS2SX53_9BACI|nr:hypothetical protein [Shouchella xiaoxiensis]MBM7840123.1 hypothetical protein [Shouchella xiaoxiensis]GAF15472.1 hypothetical protein JCM19045_4842 [Bacillus sp. JCM 19045]GAF18118.1 hypothetical protein JCM19046_2672 [Bacillus sp. JCM 19046]